MDGTWVEGRRSGPGTKILPDGAVFESAFRTNLREGRGALWTAGGQLEIRFWEG